MTLPKEPTEKRAALLSRVKRELVLLLQDCQDSNRKVLGVLVDSKIVVALSGGPDSVFLLEALLVILQEEGLSTANLKACHVNHAVRAESLQDEQFCRDLCLSLGVELLVETLPAGPSDEARLRKLRYQALQRACRHFAASYLVAAHHRDDQIETFLFRLFRGSGPDGLAAMPGLSFLCDSSFIDASLSEDKISLLRPLLSFNKDEILSWFEDCKRDQAFVTDLSNSQSAYQRNFLRNQVLPMVQGRFPGALDHIEQLRSMLACDKQYFELEVERQLPHLTSPSGHLLVEPWLALPPALQGRVLIAYLNRNFPTLEVDFKLVGRLHDVMHSQSHLESLKKGLIARLGVDLPSPTKTKVLIIESQSENFLDNDSKARLDRLVSAVPIFPDRGQSAAFDAKAVGVSALQANPSSAELSSLTAPGLRLLPWLNAALQVEVELERSKQIDQAEQKDQGGKLAPFTFYLSKEHCQAALRQKQPIVLRSRCGGDIFGSGTLKHRLHRLGGRKAELLSRLAEYLPGALPESSLQWLRYLPVLALGSRVLWLPGSLLNEADFLPKSCTDGVSEPIYRLRLTPLGDHLQQTGADGSLTC